MRKTTLESMAIFMICLVIALPLSTAEVFATLTTYSLSSTGARNYRASSDTTQIVAEVSQTGVTASNLVLNTNKQIPFTSCTYQASKSICTYNYKPGQWPAGSYAYSVRYTQTGEQAASNIIVDNIAPNASILSLVSTADIDVAFKITERAYDPNIATQCSGVKTLNFYLAGQLLRRFEPNLTAPNCDYQSKIRMNSSSTNGVAQNFCVEAIDSVGNKAQTCQKLVVDKEGSEASSLQLVTSQGNPINYVSAKIGPISAFAQFSLQEYNLKSITVDASEFTIATAQKDQQKNKQAVCVPAACAVSCVCRVPLTVNLPQGGDPTLFIHTIDAAGNSGDPKLQIHITPDNTAPVLTQLIGRQCGDKSVLGPSHNNITAVIDETESGFHGRKIFLDLSSVLAGISGTSYSRVYPTSCEQAGANWLCNWNNLNVNTDPASGSSLHINAVAGSQDDAGNLLQIPETTFLYDNQPPVIVDHSIFAATKGGGEITNYPVVGGTFELNIDATDDLDLTATADFSGVGVPEERTIPCFTNGDKKTCKFTEIGPLPSGPLENAPLHVTLTDCAGNSVTQDFSMNVSILNTEQADYWGYVVGDPRPAQIDKQTLKVFPQRVYFPITMNGPIGTVTPILQQLVSCDGSTGYLAGNLLNQQLPDLLGAPSTSLIAKFNIQRGINPPNDATYNCIIKTISRTSTGYISPPEFDTVPFTLHFYNSPLGTIDSNLEKKVNDVKNSPLVKGKWINTLTNIVNKAQAACNIWTTFDGIGETLHVIAGALEALKAVPGVLPVAKALTTVSNFWSRFITSTPIDKGIKKICNAVSCTWVPIAPVRDALNALRSGAPILNAVGLGSGGQASISRALNISTDVDPRHSLLVSIGTLCLPGILYNLQKARAIECNYVYCVKTQVTNGVPPFFCDAERATQWCTYVWGEIFQFVPFAQFFDKILSTAKKLITDPLEIIAIAIEVCIRIPEKITSHVCTVIKHTISLVDAISNLVSSQSWKGVFGPPGGDICASI